VIRNRLFGAILATALVISFPASAAAQDESMTPEGIDWTLATYLDDDFVDLVGVPFGVNASLLLEDSIASGSGGCNSFSGSYQLDGTSLTFADELTRTLALCADDIQSVEDAYLSSLPDVTGWAIVNGVLELSDDFGDALLTFEVRNVAWTAGEMAALMATLAEMQASADELRDRLDNANIVRLRDRVKALEADNAKLKKQATAAAKATPAPQPISFSKAERILLEGIPRRIASRCAPLRSSLPKGTQAAVACKPNSTAVSSLNYYLMEGNDATDIWATTMSTFNVPRGIQSQCDEGIKSSGVFGDGDGFQANGCYRTNQRAEVRFVDNATDCRKLKVGGRTLRGPAFYIALQGSGNDIERVFDWATKGVDPNSGPLTSLTVPIKRPNADRSPFCRP
jgi:heat shock protein HslJ